MIKALNHAKWQVRPIKDLDERVYALFAEAEGEGHRFMRRLVEDWRFGKNRFDRKGEAFLAVWNCGTPIAVGGLNIDPYSESSEVGRVRHLYVASGARRQGVATLLMDRIIDIARGSFSLLRLRTETRSAAEFYKQFGFRAVDEDTATHVLKLR